MKFFFDILGVRVWVFLEDFETLLGLEGRGYLDFPLGVRVKLEKGQFTLYNKKLNGLKI